MAEREHGVGGDLHFDLRAIPFAMDAHVIEAELGLGHDRFADLLFEALIPPHERCGGSGDQIAQNRPPRAIVLDPNFFPDIKAGTRQQTCDARQKPKDYCRELAHQTKRSHALTAMQRVVEPEIIDRLPPDHPDVIRSRTDLKVINFLMGNERWIARQIHAFESARKKGVLEIGAGEGTLLARLAKLYPGVPLTACDLAPRPEGLPEGITWDRRDVFESLATASAGVLAANLFLHHFENDELENFRPHLEKFEVICVNEPYRTTQTLREAKFLLPIVGRATKHDMIVSIRAGFLPGELPECLGLKTGKWIIREETSWRGGLRMLAYRA
jgi:hypothetical protein